MAGELDPYRAADELVAGLTRAERYVGEARPCWATPLTVHVRVLSWHRARPSRGGCRPRCPGSVGVHVTRRRSRNSHPCLSCAMRVVLRIPHARRTFAAALLGQAVVRHRPAVRDARRDPGLRARTRVAGTVMALFGATSRLPVARGGRALHRPVRAAPARSSPMLAAVRRRCSACSPRRSGARAHPRRSCWAPCTAARGRLRAAARPDHAGRVGPDSPSDRAAAAAGVQPRRRRRGTAVRLGAAAGGRPRGGSPPPAVGVVVGAGPDRGAGRPGSWPSPGGAGTSSGRAVRRDGAAGGRRGAARGLGRPVVAAAGVGLALGVARPAGRGLRRAAGTTAATSVAWVLRRAVGRKRGRRDAQRRGGTGGRSARIPAARC